jgi:hypothetical protein
MTDLENAAILPAHAVVKSEASGVYSLDLTDIPPAPREPFSPPLEGRAWRVAFYYVSTPDEKEFWRKDMGFWSKKLNQYIEPTNLLKSTVKEALTGIDNDLDKAKKLYALTAKIENTDFTTSGEPGLGSGWIPAGSVEQVLINKKGTSNQVAFLYLALARVAGLNPRPERIASRSQRIFSPQFRDPSQLDTVLIAMNLGGNDVTVDPGSKMAPFATLHWAHSAAGGVVMNGSKVETVITPEQKITDNAVIHIGNLAVTPQGSVSGSLKVAYIGQQALHLRQIAVSNGPDAARDEINRRLSSQVPDGVQATVDHLVNVDDPNKQLLAVVAVSGKPAAQAGGRLVLPRSFFRTREANPYPADDSRISPVDVHYPEQEQDQITYVLPAGFSLEGKPEDSSAKLEQDAAYQAKAKLEGNSVTSTRVLARGFTWLAPAQYTPLRDFYQKVITADRQDLVLTPAAQATNQ